MRKSSAALAVASLLIGALALSGCSSWFENPNKPANDAIAVANAHLSKAATLETSVKSDAASLDNVPYSGTGARTALQLTSSIATALAGERAELLAAKTAMDGIEKLGVDATLKQYARLESASIDARIALADGEARLYIALDRLYTSLSKRSTSLADSGDTITAIQQMRQEVVSLGDVATSAAKKAADYFTANKLGG
jgi:hypothetical protein